MNEEYIEKVLEIEKQARAVYDTAARETEQLPAQAEEEAQRLLKQARIDAQVEARHLITEAQAQDESDHIVKEAKKEVERVEALAANHFDQAVSYVLDRVAGKRQ